MVESRCGLLCSECSYKEPCKCGGCVETNGHPFYGECPVAVCCQKKGYDHCGQCESMPCKQLYAYSYLDKEHGDNPPGARIEILKRWVNESKSHMSDELILKAEAIMKNATIATIAKIDDKGYPRASTLSNIKIDGLKTVWFSTGLTSSKVKYFMLNNKASVCYCDGENNITLIGTIEILSDPELKKQLWLDWFINHFPGGVTDPNYCILKFTTHNAILWIDNQYQEILL